MVEEADAVTTRPRARARGRGRLVHARHYRKIIGAGNRVPFGFDLFFQLCGLLPSLHNGAASVATLLRTFSPLLIRDSHRWCVTARSFPRNGSLTSHPSHHRLAAAVPPHQQRGPGARQAPGAHDVDTRRRPQRWIGKRLAPTRRRGHGRTATAEWSRHRTSPDRDRMTLRRRASRAAVG